MGSPSTLANVSFTCAESPAASAETKHCATTAGTSSVWFWEEVPQSRPRNAYGCLPHPANSTNTARRPRRRIDEESQFRQRKSLLTTVHSRVSDASPKLSLRLDDK